jgi:type III secretion protein C
MRVKQIVLARLAGAIPACAVLVCMGLTLPGLAAEPAWPNAPYQYVVVDQDLRTVLQEFGANVGVRIVLSDAVQGRVRGRLPMAPPRQFLNHLAQAYALDWFFDGSVMYVSGAAEAETRFIMLHGVDVRALEAGLRATNLYDERFGLRAGPGTGVALVSGPPRYLKVVQDTAEALATRAAAPQPAEAAPAASLTVFRGVSERKVQFP